jgi:hypothetical protein
MLQRLALQHVFVASHGLKKSDVSFRFNND